MRMGKRGKQPRRWLLLPILLCLALSAGCMRLPEPPRPPDEQSIPEVPEETGEESRGELELSDGVVLTQEQGDLLLAYMDEYYASLTSLQLGDASALFAQPDGAQALGNRAVWEYLIGVRAMQSTDLSLQHYRYIIVCREAQEQEDGSLLLSVTEHSTMRFTAYPQVVAENVFIPHSFTLVNTEQGWRIGSHMQLDSLYFTLFGGGRPAASRSVYERPWFEVENPEVYFPARVDELLSKAKEHLLQRTQEDEPQPYIAPKRGYNRDAAAEYATNWVGYRNTEWADYGWFGGNCQNYVSQCLLAGGIPMDTTGDSVWKWYGDVPNNSPGKAGRSASWSGVEPFRQYIAGNTGSGIVGRVDAPFYSGAIGDVLDLGESAEDGWRHSVLITDVMQDDSGATVDYLVSSNTADVRNFPASAYYYTYQSLIKIDGWND